MPNIAELDRTKRYRLNPEKNGFRPEKVPGANAAFNGGIFERGIVSPETAVMTVITPKLALTTLNEMAAD